MNTPYYKSHLEESPFRCPQCNKLTFVKNACKIYIFDDMLKNVPKYEFEMCKDCRDDLVKKLYLKERENYNEK